MKVSQEVWKQKAEALKRRRENYTSSAQNGIDIYKYCLSKVKVGASVLDVGCGSMILKNYLPKETTYFGIDPFPLNESVSAVAIETELLCFPEEINTVFCMASLDNCYDLELALKNISNIARNNIVILSGINIEPNEYHTLKITMNDLSVAFADFRITHNEMISPKLYLIEFTRKKIKT